MVTPETVKEQIVYEIHDPCNYLTPDVIADFSQVTVQEVAPNTVSVTGASGKAKSGYYKTSIGYQDGFLVEGEISYGGSGAYARAVLAGEVIARRLADIQVPFQNLRIDYIGVNSLYKDALSQAITGNRQDVAEVRLRVAGRTAKRADAEHIGMEVYIMEFWLSLSKAKLPRYHFRFFARVWNTIVRALANCKETRATPKENTDEKYREHSIGQWKQ